MPEALENGRLPASLRQAFNRKASVDALRASVEDRTEERTHTRELGKYKGEVQLLVRWGVVSKAEADDAIRWAKDATYEEIADQRRRMSRGGLLDDAYLYAIRYARNALEEKGASFDSALG